MIAFLETFALWWLYFGAPTDPARRAASEIGGPVLFLAGTNLFQWRAAATVSVKRLLVAAVLVILLPLAPHISIIALMAIVTGLLGALAVWELRFPAARRAVSLSG